MQARIGVRPRSAAPLTRPSDGSSRPTRLPAPVDACHNLRGVSVPQAPSGHLTLGGPLRSAPLSLMNGPPHWQVRWRLHASRYPPACLSRPPGGVLRPPTFGRPGLAASELSLEQDEVRDRLRSVLADSLMAAERRVSGPRWPRPRSGPTRAGTGCAVGSGRGVPRRGPAA